VGLETLRVFCPIAYDIVRSNPEQFAGVSDDWRSGTQERQRALAFHEGWMKALGPQRAHVQRLLVRMFPRLESVFGNTVYGTDSLTRWRRAMRACSPDVFGIYFRLSVPCGAISNAEFGAALSEEQLPQLAERLRQLASEKRADGATRARAMLDMLNDFARDEESVATAIAPKVVRALFDAGDDVIAKDATPSSPLDVDDELRIHFVIRNMLRRLATAERVAVMKEGVRTGGSLGVIAREVARLAADLGRYGGKAVQSEDQLLAAPDVDELESMMKARAAAALADGTVWKVPHIIVTLSLWRRMGDDGKVTAFVNAASSEEGQLLRLLEQFLGYGYSHGLDDRVARRSARVSLKNVEAFFDLDDLVSRLRLLLGRQGWTETQRTTMQLIVTGYERRAAGPRDPLEDFE
jgi:predicted KAP-like P-loop ATPase